MAVPTGNLPSLLSAAIAQDNVFFTSHGANQALPAPGRPVGPPGVLHVERKRFLWEERLYERICCMNYSRDVVLLPLSLWLGRSWVEVALLAGSVVIVMIVELLNTGIETAIDRIGPEWHALSKRAKDMGSAAVLLSLLLCAGIWAAALWHRFA